ncbi:MAG: DUF4390 domain-containing protein [Xanthomonadales bacterium]|nr:DUF4390 domain-containing protein [Xanthomonadales bacterium]
MPCSNAAEPAAGRLRPTLAVVLVACLALPGCGAGEAGGIEQAALERGDGRAELLLSIRLAPALREGLERGVPLTFRVETLAAGERRESRRELRYLPLTRQYQLREPLLDYSRSFDSAAAALAALERWPLPAPTGPGALGVRVRLDRTRLPAPLVLPAVFDRRWRLDSGHRTWPAPG